MKDSEEASEPSKKSRCDSIPVGLLGKVGSLFTHLNNCLMTQLRHLRRIRRPSSNSQQLVNSFRGISPMEDPYDVEIGWTQGSPILYPPLNLSYSHGSSQDKCTAARGIRTDPVDRGIEKKLDKD
jgi:hypothetical protein